MDTLLLDVFLEKNKELFLTKLKKLLTSNGITKFTLFEISSGRLCFPIANNCGVETGLFDIFDVQESGKLYSDKGKEFVIYDFVICENEDVENAIIALHEPGQNIVYLESLSLYISDRLNELLLNEKRVTLFLDYQKKIDFVKHSGSIFKALTKREVLINSVEYFGKIIQSDISCVLSEDIFEGFGINIEDLRQNIIVAGESFYQFLMKTDKSQFITSEIKSKFKIKNILIAVENTSSTKFVFFNLDPRTIEDIEFAEILGGISAIAIENAGYNEKMMTFKIEEAEMSQTVKILNQFVTREIDIQGKQEIFGINYPAKSTGGDFSIVINYEDAIFICIADVCGKGYSAAVFTVMLATTMDEHMGENRNVVKLAEKINSYLLSREFEERFITAFFAIYDKHKNCLHYVGCGHEPIILIRNGNSSIVKSNNLPLGIIDESYIISKLDIECGDLLFFYTDGVTEYIKADALKKEILLNRDNSSKKIVSDLYNKLVLDHSVQRDDFTCIAVKFLETDER